MKISNYLARASFAVALALLVVGIASTKAEATNLDYFQNNTPAFASDNGISINTYKATRQDPHTLTLT